MGNNVQEALLIPDSVHEELSAQIRLVAPQFVCVPYREEGDLSPKVADAVALLRWVGGKRFASLIETDAPRIRWLHTASAGVDHVLMPPVRKRCEVGTLVLTDSGPAFGIAIGEFVLAWMLAVSHRLSELHDQKQARRWQSLQHEELYGQTAGVIGLGPIGQGIAERCRAMGMRTIGLRRTPTAAPFVDETVTGPEGLRRLIGESDWVIIAAALTGETRHLIGEDEFIRMKTTARLVNIARGGLVDETALITALQKGELAGACLDVFATEPLPLDSPLWDLPQVHIAPHNSSGWARGLRERQRQLFLNNVSRFAAGEPLAGIVDVSLGY
ncbi:MAG: D-2-hydroxyacid dehydrogenase [Akkermansiaceae bacterium]|nr:D-2-hydroxyacid dehydrogenase [Armatimonadota bacterium]